MYIYIYIYILRLHEQVFSSTCDLFIYQAPLPASLSSDPPPPPLGHLPTVLSLGLALQHPSSPRRPTSSHCTNAAGQGSGREWAWGPQHFYAQEVQVWAEVGWNRLGSSSRSVGVRQSLARQEVVTLATRKAEL